MQWINGSDNVKRKRNGISMGYIVLLALMIIFFIRAGSVLNSYRERGGLAYVQLLNYSMPVVETQIYDSTAYRENKVTIKRVIVEALGLNKITTYGIIGNEVAFFSNINNVNSNGNLDNSAKSTFNLFETYVVKEESIARVTEEDLADTYTEDEIAVIFGAAEPQEPVSNVVFTSAGADIEDITKVSEITVSADFAKDKENCVMILSVYDKDGRVLNTGFTPVDMTDATETVTKTVTVKDFANAASCKVFVVESFATLTPQFTASK